VRAFVLRARAAPTDSRQLLAAVGHGSHSEVLAHTLMNAIFVAQSHRSDVVVFLVLESTRDFSRTVRFDAAEIAAMGGFHEQALLAKVARALDTAVGMGKDEERLVEPGISVRTTSFEKLVGELARDFQLYILDKKAAAFASSSLKENACFLLTITSPCPEEFQQPETARAKFISLGPRMLFASQCVVLIHNELDLRES